MRSSLFVRRASYAALSVGLLAAGLVPLAASAATAACPTYVDPKGDSAPGDPALAPLLGDDGLDILAVTHSTSAGVLSSTVKTAKLLETGSDNSFGDWFQVGFTVADKAVTVRVVRDANIQDTMTTRLQVAGVTVPDAGVKAVYDFKAATVTLTVTQAVLEKAIGAKLGGKPFSEMETLSYGYYGGPGLLFDDAVADEKAGYVFGTACKGAAAGPAPAASSAGSPEASASASPKTSASPAASASPSGTPAASGSPAASASASPSGSPAPAQPTVPVPAAGCFGFADPKGDARPGNASAPNDPHLDIVAVTGRTAATELAGHLQIDKLGTRPSFAAFTGQRYEYQFTVGGKVVLLRANAAGPGEGLVDGVVNPDLKTTAVFDVVSSQVVLSVERAGLAKALGRELPEGTFLEAQIGRSVARSPAPVAFSADTATTDDAARARYTVGDNTCFAPKISVSLPGQVQTSDRALISVSMTTSDGRAAAGQTVIARVGGSRAVSAKTDKQGNATLSAPVTDAAGSRLLVVRSSGSAGRGELASEMRVVTERALLFLGSRGSGAARTVTATLTDDDAPRRNLAGQRVVFSFDGRSVTATTDSAGRASAAVPAGTVVEATFAGRLGFLTPAKARARV